MSTTSYTKRTISPLPLEHNFHSEDPPAMDHSLRWHGRQLALLVAPRLGDAVPAGQSLQPVFPSEYVLYGHSSQGEPVALPAVALALLAAPPFKTESSGVNSPAGHARQSLPLAEK